MPASWAGEVHDDSLILSQALYSLRNGGTHSLGAFTAGPFAGQPRSDVFIFDALFYFPDNFANFRDALEMACLRLEPDDCPGATGYLSKINGAFTAHGISAPPVGGDYYEPNNGPSYATDASSMSVISGTINPAADADYYSLPLNKGTFTAKLSLPATAEHGLYSAFALHLYDADRNIVRYPNGDEVIATPKIYDCVVDRNCRTDSPSVALQYDVAQAGRYYLLVAVDYVYDAYTGSAINAGTFSSSPYTLALDFTPQGTAEASIITAAFDADIISFKTPYASFNAVMNPSSPDYASAETVFEYAQLRAQLRDHNYQPLEFTKTNAGDSYMQLVSDSLSYSLEPDYLGRYIMSGQVRLQSGFAARYPGVGTVYLEIFGHNRFGTFSRTVSLGVSNAINLSTNKSDAVAYNNVLNAANSRSIIKYDVQSGGSLSIKVYTQSGALVKTVYDGSVTAGKGTVDWDGTDDSGRKAASGIYFIKAKGPGLNKVDKIAIVR
jgi:membrane-bound inhibitor of C-type lysozyme